METDRFTSALPVYFDDKLGELPIMPFLVASLQNSQDTLLFAPQDVSDSHDRFIDQLYRDIGYDQKTALSIRCFLFNKMISLALLFPTELRDEGGRAGLTVSIGLLLRGNVFTLQSKAVLNYLKVYLNLLNRTFDLSLPQSGADRFLEKIRSAHSKNELNQHSELGTKIITLLDSLIIAAASSGEVVGSRWKWSRRRWRVKRRLPKVIVYDSQADYYELLGFFLHELDRAVTRKGRTGIHEPFTDRDGTSCISLLALEGCLRDASRVELKKRHRQRYLNIY